MFKKLIAILFIFQCANVKGDKIDVPESGVVFPVDKISAKLILKKGKINLLITDESKMNLHVWIPRNKKFHVYEIKNKISRKKSIMLQPNMNEKGEWRRIQSKKKIPISLSIHKFDELPVKATVTLSVIFTENGRQSLEVIEVPLSITKEG